jgi:hypothetical protein
MTRLPSRPVLTTRRRVLGGAAAGVLGLSLIAARPLPTEPPSTSARIAGMTFVWTVTSSSTDKNRKKATDSKARVRIAGDRVRMDYQDGTGPAGFSKDAYTVLDGKAGTINVVNAKNKEVVVMDAAAFGTGMGMALNNPMMKMTISNVSFSYTDLGAGEPVLGRATRKVRVRHGYTVEMKILGMTQRTTSSDSSDQWIAKVPEFEADGLMAWSKSFGAGIKASAPELAKLMDAYEQDYTRGGMVLKSVTWSTETDKNGKSQQDVVTTEVTELSTGDLDPAIFEIPAGYKVVNVGDALKSAQAALDSAAKGDSAGKADAKKPSAADAVKSGLGGVLRGRRPPR